MNHLKGPIKVIFKDLKLQLYIFTAITLVLVIIYNGVGLYVGPDNFYPFISGPIYGILLFTPFFMFGDALKSTIGLGGTRINYLTSLIINYLVYIISLVIVHNVLFQLSELITDHTKSTMHIYHIARFFGVSNAISYFWVDMLIGIFFVGTGTIIAAVLYRFGYVWTLGITLGLGVLGFLWFTLGDMGEILKWILENKYLLLHLLGVLGVVCMMLTYPLMKQVKLKL